MPFKKGQSGNPKGKPKGASNIETRKAREAIAKFVEGNLDNFEEWLERVAEDNPAEAIKLVSSVMEYHLPKLQRSEQQHLDKNGNPADNKIIVEIVDVDKDTK